MLILELLLLSLQEHTNYFKSTIKGCTERQAKNPVDVFIKGNNGKLFAEVVDSNAGKELGITGAQRIFHQNERGVPLDVGFILDAERRANKLNSVNEALINMIKDTEKAVTK